LIAQYVRVYNEQRLHSSIGYITPKDMLAGRRQQIHAERDRKLEQARKQREEIGRLRSNPVQENAA
jgi:putative transposase